MIYISNTELEISNFNNRNNIEGINQMKKEIKQIVLVPIDLTAVLITGCVDQVSEMSADEIASMMKAK